MKQIGVPLLACALCLTACGTSAPVAPTASETTVISSISSSSSSAASSVSSEYAIRLVSPSGETLTIHGQLATTRAEQERGLMFVDTLPPDAGMLFVFDQPQVLDFWMKDTHVPLDVLFFGADKHYVSRQTMTPCVADPCAIYSSNAEAQYALEVTSGYGDSHSVGAGWMVEW